MSYISPIKIGELTQMEEGWVDKIGKYIAGEVDNLVLESCVKVGCHVDKDELEKALRYDRGQYLKGYADGKRDAAPRWHRVEDELPNEFDTVIACGRMKYDHEKDYEVFVDAAEYGPFDYSHDRWVTWNDWYEGQEEFKITHWMPLPEPPKEDA